MTRVIKITEAEISMIKRELEVARRANQARCLLGNAIRLSLSNLQQGMGVELI